MSEFVNFILIPGLLEDVAKSRSSSFDQSKPYEPSNGNGNPDFGAASSGHKDSEQQSASKHLQPHSPDLIPERGKDLLQSSKEFSRLLH